MAGLLCFGHSGWACTRPVLCQCPWGRHTLFTQYTGVSVAMHQPCTPQVQAHQPAAVMGGMQELLKMSHYHSQKHRKTQSGSGLFGSRLLLCSDDCVTDSSHLQGKALIRAQS